MIGDISFTRRRRYEKLFKTQAGPIRSTRTLFLIDPLGQPRVTAGRDHCLNTCRPSVPTFQNLAKQNKFQAKTMFTTGENVGLAEWIIDDTCLVLWVFLLLRHIFILQWRSLGLHLIFLLFFSAKYIVKNISTKHLLIYL